MSESTVYPPLEWGIHVLKHQKWWRNLLNVEFNWNISCVCWCYLLKFAHSHFKKNVCCWLDLVFKILRWVLINCSIHMLPQGDTNVLKTSCYLHRFTCNDLRGGATKMLWPTCSLANRDVFSTALGGVIIKTPPFGRRSSERLHSGSHNNNEWKHRADQKV